MRDKSKKLTVVNTGSDRFKGYSSKDAQRMVSGTRNVSGIWEQEGAGGSSDYLSAINDDEASGIISFLKGLILDGVLLDETLREDDERLPTDHNIMTSSRVLKELTKLDTRYLRKDKDDRSKGKISSNKGFEVGQFVSGASGASLHMEKESGRTVAELDKLYVRVKAIFETLEIVNVNSVGGKQIISPAGAMKCLGVQDKVYLFNEEGEPILDSEGNQQYEELDFYRCYFLAEQDGEKIENRFKPGDQVYCKLFNAFTGVGNKIRSKWYWRLVENVNKNEDAVEYDGKLCHYIDLSKTICDVDSDIPEAGDIICHRGSLNDVDRQNFLEFSSVDSFSPSITLYQGVGGIYDRSKGEWVADYSLIGKDMVQFGVNTSTGKAFMNVYGDMYVGERSTIDEDGNMIEPKSYLRFVQGQGLEVKGKISVNSTIGDSEEETLGKFITDVHNDIQNLQNQVDGAIESFFYDYVPTLENYPASEWIETGTEELHLNDTFTHTEDGRSWRWVKDKNGVYSWAEISDTQSAEALRLAALAKDTADGKRRVFITTADKPHPNPPYDPGDLWTRGSEYPLLVCVVQKQAGQYYEQIDWALADNTEKVKEELDVAIKENAKNLQELNKSLSDTKEYIDGAFSDGIITESEKIAIGKYINQIETVKEQADESYGQVYNNELLLDKANDGSFADSTAKINLKNAYDVLSTSIYDLIEKINSVIEDDEATSDEIADVDFKYELFNQKYGDYIRCLNAAINYIELKINSKVEQNIIELGGYSYLKEALKDGARTEINGGLVQSTLLALGEYSDDGNSFKVWAGTSGIYDERKIGNGIASWYGGGNIDRFDYYDYTNNVFNVPSGIRAAAGVDRMDGTGYRANGKLWWDKDGVVHADPLSFFIGEATVGGLLASFQVVMKSDNRLPDYLIPKVPFQSLHVTNLFKIGSGSDSVELKYDSSNNALYIQKSDGSPVNFYSTGGISMYGQGDTSVKTIMDAIVNNLDRNTLDVQNGLITVVGGGGIESITKQMVIDALEYTPYDASNPNGYITSATLDGYLPLSGGVIDGWVRIQNNKVGDGALYIKGISTKPIIRFDGDVSWGYLGFGSANKPCYYDNSLNEYNLIHSGNIGSQSVNYANSSGDADTLDGYHIASENTREHPWGKIPIVRLLDGVMEVGQYIDFHYDTSIIDYSTRIHSYGNHRNTVILPSANGTIALITDNVASATKLQTPRTIWGQSFDGMSDITGNIILPNSSKIFIKDTSNNDICVTQIYGNDLHFGDGANSKGYDTYIGGNKIIMRYGTSPTWGFVLSETGNVGIGGVIYPQHKLDVNGDIYSRNKVIINGISLSKSQDGVLYLDGNLVVKGCITMYGTDATSAPSILDSLPKASYGTDDVNKGIASFDGNYFRVTDGYVSLIPDNVGLNESKLEEYLAGKDYLTTSNYNSYAPTLTGGGASGNWNIYAKGITPMGSVTDASFEYFNNSIGFTRGISICRVDSSDVGDIPAFSTVVTLGVDRSRFIRLASVKGTGRLVFQTANAINNGFSSVFNILTDQTYGTFLDSVYLKQSSYTAADILAKLKTVDGAGSGLDADLLDGKHISEISKYIYTVGTAYALTADSDLDTVGCGYYTSTDNIVYPHAPVTNFGLLTVNLNGAYKGQIVFPYGSNYEHIRFRSQVYENGVIWNGWRKLAYIDDNVASATYATTAGNAEKFAGVDFATLVSIIPTNTNQLTNGAGFITSSGYSAGVTDYYDRTSNINIGYQSSSLTASQVDYIAAYSIASGNIVIKDVDKSTMQSWLGLSSFAYKSSLAFSELTSKPTTISGYGITDAITTSNIGSQSVNYATSSGSCTGNAASATKLSDNTSYTIWGQEFFVNGKPKSVNGAFRLLRAIPGTVVIHKALVYPTSPYGLITRAYIDGGISLQVQREDNDSECFNLLLNPLGGNVGIGTPNPAYKLDISGRERIINNSRYVLEITNSQANGSAVLSFNGADGNESGQVCSSKNGGICIFNYEAYRKNSNGCTGVGIDENSRFYIGKTGDPSFDNFVMRIDASGNLLVLGGITMYSARILKNIVDERGLSLSELSVIKPTRYTWKDGRDSRLHFGGIADDIQQVLPEVVYKTAEGVLTMDYGNAGFAIASSLIKPVIDHETKIRMLEIRVKELEEELKRYSA